MLRDLRARRRSFLAHVEALEPRHLLAGLIQEADLDYLGAFRLPGGTFGTSSFDYGGTALAYNAANNSLFMVGHDWDQAVAEVNIPTLKTGSIGGLNTATVRQNFVSVLNGLSTGIDSGDELKVGGLMVNENQLIGSAYVFYDADGDQRGSHFKLSSLNLSSSTKTGLHTVGTIGGGWVGGWMTAIPDAWQDELGTSYLTGNGALSIISRTSWGPSAFGFDPAQLGSSTALAAPLLYYTQTNPLASLNGRNEYFNGSTQIRGIAFPEESDSVLYFGSHGTGSVCYGTGSECGDSVRPDKGYHAYPYRFQVWAYDAHDLAAAKNGQLQPWEVRPYDVWELDLPYPGEEFRVGGVAYDAASNRIYVTQQGADDWGLPIVHAFQVSGASGDTTAPLISGVASSNVSSSGATIRWNTNEAADTQIEYGTTTAYGSSTTRSTVLVTSHAQTVSGLNPGTTYHYRVKSRDAAGNLAVSGDFTLTTAAAADTTAPTADVVDISPDPRNSAVGDVSITFSENMTGVSLSDFTLTRSGSAVSLAGATLTGSGASYTLNLSGVTGSAGNYALTLVASGSGIADAAGNVLAANASDSWTTDTTAPSISGLGSSNVSSSGATISWATSEGSDTQIEYGATTSYGSSTTLDTARVTSHSQTLSGLSPDMTYHYRVKSRDAAGNLALSGDFTFTTAAASAEPIYSYDNPKPLLPPSGDTVTVSTVSQLINAVNNLRSGQTILIAAGTYNLSGITDALYVRQGITNWSIRGATGDRDDVIIKGGGMSGSVRFGFWTNSPSGMIADLTIDGVSEHGIIANPGAHNLLIHGVRIVDSGSPFVKSNPGSDGLGNNGGIVEYSIFEYRTTDSDNYTNGVDVHGGDGWLVKNNLFKNFLSPPGQGIAGPAVLMWNGSKNSIVDGNTFVNVARGISLGLVDKSGGFDHQGGVISNNMLYRDASLASSVDVPIMVADSPNTAVYHNTVIARGSYPNAIEYRYPSSTGLQIKNNLTDGAIVARDGASATLAGNKTNATLGLFINPAAGDLHLVSTATAAINQGVAINGFTADVDGQTRDSQLDLGADEFVITAPPPDTTAPTADIVDISPDPRNSVVGNVAITFSENVTGVTLSDFTLTRSGSSVSLSGATLTGSGASYTLNLTNLTGGEGNYALTLVASGSGIADAASNPLAADASDSWAMDLTVPAANIENVSPDPRNSTVGNVAITFSESVAGVSLSDFSLTRNGNAVSLSGATLTGSGSSYTLNLSGVTSTEGDYALTLTANGSGIVDSASNTLASNASDAWTMDSTAPTADVLDISPDPRNNSVGDINFVFSESVTGVTLSDFALTRNGSAVSLSGATLSGSGASYALNISGATGSEGEYIITLVAEGSGIFDTAGNSLASNASDAWTTDTTDPTADVVDISPDPRNSAVGDVSITFSENVTGVSLSDFTLTRSGSAVSLAGATLTGSGASYTLNLSGVTGSAGNYALTLVASGSGIVDAAGNALAANASDSWTTDTTAPSISGLASSNVSSSGATIRWNTDEAADTQIEYGTTTAYGSSTTRSTVLVTSHAQTVSGLNPGTTYHYRVKSRDAAGNLAVSGDFTLTTAAAADTTAPTADVVDISPDPRNSAVGDVSITFSENVTGVSLSDFTLTRSGSAVSLAGATLTGSGASYTLNLSGVTGSAGNYALTLVASGSGIADAAGNVLAANASDSWTTDTTAPSISGLGSSNVSSSGATISWATSEGSDTQIEYGATTSYGSSTTLDTARVTSHSQTLSGLSPDMTYHYRVKSRDAAGNLALSGDFTFTTAAASAEPIYSYDNPKPLLPPSGDTVTVSTVSQLINAVNNLRSGQTILIAAGTYNLSGITDALYVRQGITNWSIRGATGDRDDVIIKGGGMSGSVRFGFWTNSPSGMIADLTIDGVSEHGIIANPGAHNLLIHGVRIVDSGSPFVKSNPGSDGLGNNGGIVEYSIFEYRTTDSDNYTNGVDVHGGDGWLVKNNLFKNFLSPPGQGLAGPAVLIWNGSKNTVVDGNTFLNVARGISLGLLDKAGGFDHQGGVISNNMFYRDPTLTSEVDVAIMVADSPNTAVYHNTLISRGSYPNAIEYRYSSSTGLQIKNNLTDGAIVSRDGASATVSGNKTNATLDQFVNPAAGDLHLVSTATAAINQGTAISGFTTDVDGQTRDAQLDLGADEFVVTAPPPEETPPPPTAPGVIDWGTVEFADMQDQSLSGAETWYSFTAARSGKGTIEAFFDHAAGNIELAVMDADMQPLATSATVTNHERIDLDVTAGALYYVKASGANANVDLRVTNLVGVVGTAISVFGTSGNDVFRFAHGGSYTIAVNGVSYLFAPAQVSRLTFSAGNGSDLIEAELGALDDAVTLRAGQLEVTNSAYRIEADSIETVSVIAGTGLDKVWLYDTSGNDTFSATPAAAQFTGPGMNHTVSGFDQVFAQSAEGGFDVARLYDSRGSDTFDAGPTTALLRGSTFYNRAEGFDNVQAHSTAGGTDTANLFGSAGDDLFTVSSNLGKLTGNGYSLSVDQFEQTRVYGQGGNDKAQFREVRSTDKVYGRNNYAELTVSSKKTTVYDFGLVEGYAKSGHRPTANVRNIDYLFKKYGTWR